MKDQEEVITKIKYTRFIEKEELYTYMKLEKDKPVFIYIKIKQLVKIEDLFEDNTCLKRLLRGGKTSE